MKLGNTKAHFSLKEDRVAVVVMGGGVDSWCIAMRFPLC